MIVKKERLAATTPEAANSWLPAATKSTLAGFATTKPRLQFP